MHKKFEGGMLEVAFGKEIKVYTVEVGRKGYHGP
jgi:hypothetical protein